MKTATPDSIKLFHDGAIALAQIERNGIRIDLKYLEKALKNTAAQIKHLEEEFKQSKVYKKWEKKFGFKTALGNKKQLGAIVFDELGYKRSGNKTDKGEDSNSKGEFEKVDRSDVRTYFHMEEMKKARKTYLFGIQKELVGEYMYPIINLHIPQSYRSSAQRPNIQNFPVRNIEMADIVRNCVIPPNGWQILELDYGGIEVCGSACYHKDPQMIKYITDPSTDMHRDMAMQIFKLKQREVSKLVRYCAKNGFVFPEFYGSYYVDCASNMWDMMELLKLQTEQGVPMREHMAKKGIKTLEKFTNHVEEAEQDFWDVRFKVYKQWKYDYFQQYVERGWFRFKTGFVISGKYNRKQVCNYPIQGASFHCLLWSLIRLQNWMNKSKLRSKIFTEIHDSIGIYCHPKERDDIIAKAIQIMTKDILKHWDWIIVPLTVEAEVAPIGESWHKKKKMELAA